MRLLYAAAVLACAATAGACSDQSPVTARTGEAPLIPAAAGHRVDDSYIVVLREGADPRSVAAVAGVAPRYVYTSALNGFAAPLNQGQLTALRHNPNVEYVEQEQTGGIQAVQSNPTWGLDRIDQRYLPLSRSYTYTSDGTGVRVYVLDTGIQANHPQFGTRASNVWDFEGRSGADCHGHGTHVAGTVGSTTYGVAKNVQLRGLRVVDCAGYGGTAAAIAAMDWVRLNHVKPAVANVSLRYPFSAALNTAANSMVSAGVFTAVATGIESQDACNVSPASASGPIKVNAVDRFNARAPFSNFGACTDIYAPGVDIVSTWIGGSIDIHSGTSMASPHVAGMGALYKSRFGDEGSSYVKKWINSNATWGVVTGNPANTPNRLLFTGSTSHTQGSGGSVGLARPGSW